MSLHEDTDEDRWPMHADTRVFVVFAAFSLVVTTAPIWRSIFAL